MLDLEFLFCRQIHMIVIVFHVQGLLLTLLYIQVSSGFVKACQTPSEAFPSRTINFTDFGSLCTCVSELVVHQNEVIW